MADKKVSSLSAITNLSADDLLMVVNDPAGTPESKKVTVGNLFGNVVVSTTHKALTTFTANTNHTGTTATFSANVVITGVGGVNADINDRMQVANTTLLVNDRMQVANLTSTYTTNTAFQSYVANTNPRLTQIESDVSSAESSLALKSPIASPTFTGTATTPALIVSTKSADPATSNAVTESITAGSVFYSNTFLYIATDSNTIKRVALSTF
jgi:hypothetical protein